MSSTDFLRHICDEIRFIREHAGGLEFEAFLADEVMKRAEQHGFGINIAATEQEIRKAPVAWRTNWSASFANSKI